MTYVQRKFYLPEETYYSLTLLAQSTHKTISQVHREVVDEGLRHTKKYKGGQGAQALLDLARRAEREGWGRGAPRDLSTNHNKYFVQAYEELKEGKQRPRP